MQCWGVRNTRAGISSFSRLVCASTQFAHTYTFTHTHCSSHRMAVCIDRVTECHHWCAQRPARALTSSARCACTCDTPSSEAAARIRCRALCKQMNLKGGWNSAIELHDVASATWFQYVRLSMTRSRRTADMPCTCGPGLQPEVQLAPWETSVTLERSDSRTIIAVGGWKCI